MAIALFYDRPVALNRARHGAMRLAIAPDHYRFAARTNAVPIMSTEFAVAARDYPIVFVGEPGVPFNVAALVGLRDGENLLVDADGHWAADTYVPAFARRYPFVLAPAQGDGQYTVCIDEAYAGLGPDAGEPLFDDEGQETPYLRRVLEFLQAFHVEATRTSAFAERLRALGLLVPKVVDVARRDRPRQRLRGLWVVDEALLRGLTDAQVLGLFRRGDLAWIDAHLLSLGSLTRLVARLGAPATGADGADGQPPASVAAVPGPAAPAADTPPGPAPVPPDPARPTRATPPRQPKPARKRAKSAPDGA